ncbi:TPA: primosomal protein N', partial [Candidatus Bipolaricaulota bacterium]|nr:primosomal protein N' [Candidatus Bipolaricaulota bacterium]
MIARVALPLPKADPFDYLVPEGMEIRVGDRVLVPLGKRRLWGVVVELLVASTHPGELQRIEAGQGRVIPPRQLSLFARVAADSFVSLGLALGRLIPPQARSRAKRYRLTVSPGEAQRLLKRLQRRAPAQARALAAVLAGEAPPAAPARALLHKGLLKPEPLPFSFSLREARVEPTLTPGQEQALEAISAGEGNTFLLYGPPGAGKTEVYLRAAREVLGRGRTALLLEPEVSLLPQLWARAEAALAEEVALYFGELPAGERWRVWQGALEGGIRAAAGTRSAAFLPLPELGLVVVDEEGEPAYKQEEMAPYYHAREVARLRARHGAAVVLGTAAPQVETYFAAEQGEIRLLPLPERVVGTPPRVQLVPKGEEVIGPELQAAMDRHLTRGEQVLLFINRRGFFTGAACRACGAVLRCPGCEVPLAFYLAGRVFRCHVCGRTYPRPRCSRCGGERFRLFGVGSERVEFEAKRLFPSLSVARLDTDTAPRRGEILAALARGEIDVLVGTQMVGKGLDFPRITLVGVIDADVLLSLPDFRAGERTFQLLLAAGGRAGRGPLPGEVIVQTDQPDHYAIRYAARGDYLGFYREELRFRESL